MQPRAMFLLRLMPVSRLLLPCCLLQVHRSEGLIYVVLEFGDIDLARLLQVRRVCWCTGVQVECMLLLL